VYRESLEFDRRVLLEEFHLQDFARKVVGVGSVGTRAWIGLMMGRDGNDPLFLQIKEAEASVLEPFLGASEFANHGQRVVTGQRLMQAVSDIFLGWVHNPQGLEGLSRDRADGSRGHGGVRPAVRLDPGPRALAQWRPHRDRLISRGRQHV
jgi:hypothetical protein